ncbi:glypican-5a isoform X1 [Corythoichthys intestinalis]|uniref:glypican-5a isoform X1 n=2 Tax=Corythoichthys intestinalis TaxID=161448 RepID=UPI0025A56EFD|nr:glypican-5a isoform X1 [Corythoichthys intestinalis]XP_061796111.1 glypican-5-like [Nerophis lumbriciformis]
MWTSYTFLLAYLCVVCFGNTHKCDDVRKVFQLRQIGPNQLLPLSPRPGLDLQVCRSKSQSCCTKKMEERYQIAARRDIENLLQTSSSSLKFLISRNVAAFQGSFEFLRKQAENHTNVLLQEYYGNMADQTEGPVRELFTDISLFLLGSEVHVEDFVQRFFDALFPIVYNRFINPGLSELSAGYAECVRSSSREVRPFGGAPGLLADQIARSGVSGKVLLQALHLGIEVINTTDHLLLSRECRKALLKMHYCPHCQGLTQSKPCMGYCLNVMRGCLASMAEIDHHWREFVQSLEDLSAQMHGPHDLEQVLLGIHKMLHDAVGHAQRNGPHISAQVHKLCGPPSRKALQTTSIQHSSKESTHLKTPAKVSGDSLALKRRDFLNSLRLYRTYYGGLADQLCVSELASADGLSCWNGTDIVKSYTLRVVGSGIKAQAANPEVKVKGADPVIHQIIDKLKHINQLLQGKSIPKLGTLDQIETGSGDAEGHYSGDCDDEDGCGGSGSGEIKNIQKVYKLNPDVSTGHNHHNPPVKDSKVKVLSRSVQLTGSIVVMMMPWLHVLHAL